MESSRTYGLRDEYIAKIKSIFNSEPKIQKAILFGSRAKGSFRRGSDIDIALKGENLSHKDVMKLQIELDKFWRGYRLDIVLYDRINEPDLKEHIDRVGKEL